MSIFQFVIIISRIDVKLKQKCFVCYQIERKVIFIKSKGCVFVIFIDKKL